MRAVLVLLVLSSCATTRHSGPTAPAGWRIDRTVLVAPEGSPRISLTTSTELELGKLTPVSLTRTPPQRGWAVSASGQSPGQRVEVRQFDGVSYVFTIEGDEASLARREAQIDSVIDSVVPRGMKEEQLSGLTPRAIDQKALDAFLVDALARLEVPGAAVAITQHGKVIYEKSLGRRALGHQDPVTPNTLFLMASVTKPMTTLMEASLVDSGLFAWETKVTTLMPEFALGDPELTKRLELWHMSCACTGMPRRDLENLFEYGNVTPEQRLAQMREMKPTTALGETFQYSNLMVAAGGFVAAHAYAPKLSLTEAYAKVMREKFFAPLGMTSSTIDFAVVTKSEHASPHALDIDGHPREIALGFEGNVGPIAPAGAVWSNLRDMERYALTELARGVAPDGTRVVSEKNFAERLRPRAPDSGYGLGVGVHKMSGLTAIGHDGGADGFGTSLLLIPELDLGLIILTNVRNGTPSEQLPFNAAVKRKVVELLYAEAQSDSPVIIDFALTQRREAARVQSAGVDRAPDLSAFFGHYESESLGSADLRPGGVFDAGEWQVRVGRRGNELVVLDAPFAGTPLPLGDDAAQPTISAPDPQQSYVFKRVR